MYVDIGDSEQCTGKKEREKERKAFHLEALGECTSPFDNGLVGSVVVNSRHRKESKWEV